MSTVFSSGAKSSEERPRYDLIPREALQRYAERCGLGARLHGDDNWKKGIADPAYQRDRLNHLWDHLTRYTAGDRSEDHLGAILWGAGALCWFEAHRVQAATGCSVEDRATD